MTNTENLLNRRSIRKFKPEQITDEELETVLEAGAYAASGMNRQSAIVIALQDPETISEFSKVNAEIMGRDTDPFYGAPTVLIVLADKSVPTHVYDGSLVMGNLMQAAYQIGLGSCWIHRAKEEFEMPIGKELLASLGIEGDYEGIGHCILGYPDETPEAKERKDNRLYILK